LHKKELSGILPIKRGVMRNDAIKPRKPGKSLGKLENRQNRQRNNKLSKLQ
jgi:hypothetical protein